MPGTHVCDNPRCTCEPCTCEDCRCNTARLGRLEQQVMQVLWTTGTEMSGSEVAGALPSYAYTTVATVLDRLSHKGLVRRRWEGRARRYEPTGSQSEHTASLMHEALRDSDEPGLALRAFVASMTSEERDTLRETL